MLAPPSNLVVRWGIHRPLEPPHRCHDCAYWQHALHATHTHAALPQLLLCQAVTPLLVGWDAAGRNQGGRGWGCGVWGVGWVGEEGEGRRAGVI